ncbi:MAG TPA: LPS export ABC transporter permease LptF [Rhodocyclaceae bacterium]|nr:LPS export ABC transporter permease LptF [Rhodocyclaceae bacterium]
MIYRRAVQREFAQTALVVFVALFSILMTTQLIRLLGQAAGGRVAPEAVMALLGFGALGYLPVLLSLTLFVSVLMTLSRMYRDSEMVVWFSSGLSLRDWINPVLRFAVPIIVSILALSMYLAPWAQSKSGEMRQRMDQRDDVSKVSPGVFRESTSGDKIFFVEGVSGAQSGNGQVKNVFMNSVQHGRIGIMAAASGHVEQAANGDRFVVLEKGHRYEGMPGTPEYRVMEFERYALRTETRESRGVEVSPRALSLHQLVRDPTPINRGELLWRIGVPVSATVLALLAIPLSFVNPRAGRANNLVFAVLAFMIYSNLISLCQAWVARGKLPFELGVWVVHIVMLLILLLLFWRRLSLFSWSRLWR